MNDVSVWQVASFRELILIIYLRVSILREDLYKFYPTYLWFLKDEKYKVRIKQSKRPAELRIRGAKVAGKRNKCLKIKCV